MPPTSPLSPLKKGRRSASLAGSSSRVHDDAFEGFTDAGEQFLVPETLDTVATLIPWNWSVTSVLTLSLVLLNAYCIAFMQWSKWPHVFYFLFFRCCYDIGLGSILRAQSEHKTFSLWYQHHTTLPPHPPPTPPQKLTPTLPSLTVFSLGMRRLFVEWVV